MCKILGYMPLSPTAFVDALYLMVAWCIAYKVKVYTLPTSLRHCINNAYKASIFWRSNVNLQYVYGLEGNHFFVPYMSTDIRIITLCPINGYGIRSLFMETQSLINTISRSYWEASLYKSPVLKTKYRKYKIDRWQQHLVHFLNRHVYYWKLKNSI